MLADPCEDSGIFDRGVQARLPEYSSDNVFLFSFLSSTFAVLQWFISKKTIILQSFGVGFNIFQEGPMQPFLGGSFFSRGVGGPNANSRNQ